MDDVKLKEQVNTLKALYNAGQSPWYDNIDRRLINDGRLKDLFDTGIRGVTSNPAIFEKAISGSSVYDDEIQRLSEEGLSIVEIFDELSAWDVRAAADLLSGVYNDTRHLDGYVSIEVSPDYAYDADKTIDYARYIFRKVGRPNIMVKIPGTDQGFKAVRTLIAEGMNINVTLLFSVAHYEKAAQAYIEGLRNRLKANKPIDSVVSVASVFVSRIDTRVDKMLDDFKAPALKGKAAVANSKLIYQRFKELFSKENFAGLQARGARVQRPLWASTSTKNPDYNDCLYVEELIGPHTINTMPHNTVNAFLEHGRVKQTLEKDIHEAQDALNQLKDRGIDINLICQEIQEEGIGLFLDSFHKLIQSLKSRCSAIA